MKILVTYRMEKEVVAQIKGEAEARGIGRAELITEWAMKHGKPPGGVLVEGEKKLGEAVEVLQEKVKAKALPAVMRGSELPEPKKPFVASMVGLPGQVRDLASDRGVRAPLSKRGGGLL